VSTDTLLTPTVISNELLRRFKNNLSFAAGASHEYDAKFDKIGDTYNLRVPVRFTAVKSATLSLQDITETKVPLQLTTQAHTGFQFGSKDLTLTVDRFGDRYLDSAAVALSNAFDADGLTMAYQATHNLVGTPGTTPNTLKLFKQASAKLDKNACPFDGKRTYCINSDAETEIVDSLKGLFQSSEQIKNQYVKGRMGTAMGGDWVVDQNVRTHTPGTPGAGAQVDGVGLTGATIAVKGLTSTSGAYKKGDIITFTTVYAVNPVSGDVLPDLRQFTITADTAVVGAGTTIASLPIDPPITISGASKTCSNAPADGSAITLVTTTAVNSPQNLVYHKDAFCYAMAPLELPKGVHFAGRAIDEQTGLSIRIVSSYDITNDLFATRADILYGWAARRPSWSCRIAG
jgi:hypothetical protein